VRSLVSRHRQAAFSRRFGLLAILGSAILGLALSLAGCAASSGAGAKPARAGAPRVPAEPVREADEYTRYELLAPGSGRFHILYEVTATDPGATVFFNPIRPGSAASGESVRDLAGGETLRFEVVGGEEARRSGLPEAEPATRYIRIHLPRPVPAEGGVRLLIEKTYEDRESYALDGPNGIVFARPLGIRRNAVVLPAGYELVALNLPAQVSTAPDGRLVVSFMHPGPDAAPLAIRARRLPRGAAP
jgi:hypothetical protein